MSVETLIKLIFLFKIFKLPFVFILKTLSSSFFLMENFFKNLCLLYKSKEQSKNNNGYSSKKLILPLQKDIFFEIKILLE